MGATPLTTRLLEGDKGKLLLDRARLSVTRGPDKGAQFDLGVDTTIIGSADDATLVLHDTTVSSRHAEITATTRGYELRDLGSKNGIWVGQIPLERGFLVDGMRIDLGQSQLKVEATRGELEVPLAKAGEVGRLVAHSVKMRAILAVLEQLAPSEVPLLIEGETGTGKELLAETIHEQSGRTGPFVIFDCGAVQGSLVAAELFGHEKGAFTDAGAARPGLLEQADGGTVFLDEIGELPLELQPMLLGAIDRKTGRRVGGQKELSYNVRYVAATNRNLAEEVRAKRFREDLFYRLNVARMRIPPLRERRQDIPLLVDRFARDLGVRLPEEVRAIFAAADWPGNVRELRNTIMAWKTHPEPMALLPNPTAGLLPLSEARRVATEQFERDYLAKVMQLASGDTAQAAELAGVSRRFLQMLRAKLDPKG